MSLESPVAAASAAPVAAIEGVGADEVDGARHVAVVALCHDQKHFIGHRFPNEREESPCEIGAAPLARARILIENPERVPMTLGDIAAAQPLDCDIGRERIAPLAPDRLALARRQRGGALARVLRSDSSHPLTDAQGEAGATRRSCRASR